ncbi:hypothetical protein HX881_32060 [Pseudomonas gingeri]|uniref:hypothetical protein n=1 Tax=Pseudomonas gingeri TaxID=117681 RepID=UPI0015A045FF|nr:hypothetical protein [Pseudomonas gingeri]NVZ30225.1 hypothetical protein [Pseudomonas gingeri]
MPAPATGVQFDVFNSLVESDEDFLGLLAYSLYKRHKIEWIRSHASDNHDAFKQVACTPQQVSMCREHAEQLAKSFIDVSLEELGQEMKDAMTKSVIIEKIESLKPGFWRALGNHTLSGFASVAVALALFGLFTLYSNYQENGGLEGRIRQMTDQPPLNLQPSADPQR